MRTAAWLALAAVAVAVGWSFRAELETGVRRARSALDATRTGADGPKGPADGAAGATPAAESWPAVPELAGEVDLALGRAPQETFAATVPDSAEDRQLRALVEAHRGALYSPALSRAAAEIAYQSAVLGAPPPEAAMGFLLGSAGAADTSAAQLFVRTNREDDRVVGEVIASAIEAAVASPGLGRLRVGVAETAVEDRELERNLVVLTSWRDFDIEPTPRSVEPGGEWVLRGRLPPGYGRPTGNILYPDNTMVSIPARVAGDRFELRVPAGDRAGQMRVGVSGVDPRRGPGKLLQYQVSIGTQPPRTTTVFVPDPAREAFGADELEEAEAYALELLQADRARNGLPALELDAELSAVARAHSRDMRDAGFFGHRSPSTGLVGDRLATARYRSTAHAENLARNDSIAEAQASLMDSVGHRRNLLDPLFTRVGVGLARADAESEEGRAEWHLTQVFARPVREVTARQGRKAVIRRINRARERRGLPALESDAQLDELAQQSAGLAAANRLDELRERANRTAYRQIERLAMITAHQAYDLETFEVPDTAYDERMSTLGVGVMQSADDPSGRIGVIVIVAR